MTFLALFFSKISPSLIVARSNFPSTIILVSNNFFFTKWFSYHTDQRFSLVLILFFHWRPICPTLASPGNTENMYEVASCRIMLNNNIVDKYLLIQRDEKKMICIGVTWPGNYWRLPISNRNVGRCRSIDGTLLADWILLLFNLWVRITTLCRCRRWECIYERFYYASLSARFSTIPRTKLCFRWTFLRLSLNGWNNIDLWFFTRTLFVIFYYQL